jgi:hypothetical protein
MPNCTVAMRAALIAISLLALPLISCSSLTSKKQPVIYAAGDKATIGSLIYNLTDAETAPQLGDDPNTARTPQNRFYLVKVSVSNSGNDDLPIPAMTLVDESGQTVNELADGAGVPNWLGVVRKVAAAQTEQGYVAFDAPIKHYRLRLNDALDENEIAIDIPLTFVRDRAGSSVPTPPAESAGTVLVQPEK